MSRVAAPTAAACLWEWLLAGLLAASVADASTCTLHPNEQIQFYSAISSQSAPGKDVIVEVRGVLFENKRRALPLEVTHRVLQLKEVSMSAAQRACLEERLRPFLADHKAHRRIVVKLGEREFDLGKTRSDGSFATIVSLPATQATKPGLRVTAVLPAGDPRQFTTEVIRVGSTGLTIISDVDDTIKDTSVRHRNLMLRNTFLEPFRPVPGMAGVFANWQTAYAAQVCYVSASPWQLLGPLSAFTSSNGFPAGIFCLQDFHWDNEAVVKPLQAPGKFKRSIIEPMLKRWPQRQYIFIGDPGQEDPETYAALAREYRRQVAGIYIRDVTGDAREGKRFSRAFAGLPPQLWTVFRDASELPANPIAR